MDNNGRYLDFEYVGLYKPLATPFSKIPQYRREEPKVGNNEPCPCQSGKKYKKCCKLC
jgi:uncharacterized protein YecA (UPF0149 family)